MANTYTVKPGDTLWGIYGPNWKQLSGYTGDPTKLQIGTVLPAPPTAGGNQQQRYDELIKAGASSQAALEAVRLIPGASSTFSPPTALDVQDEQPVDVGTLPPVDTKSVENIQTATTGLADFTSFEKEKEDWEKEKKELEDSLGVKPGESIWDKMKEILLGKPSADTKGIVEEAHEEYGVTDLLDQTKQQSLKVAKLQGDLDKLSIMELAEIDRARNQVANIPTYIIDRQTTAIQREYAIQKAYKSAELGAEAAVLQALNGNLQNARALANDVVDAAVYDLTQKRADFDNLFNFFGNWISSLEDKQRDILVDARNEAIRQEDIAREETYWKLEQAIENPRAGIRVTDTLEQVAEKVNQSVTTTTPTRKWYNPDSGQVYFGSNPPAGNWINYGTAKVGTTETDVITSYANQIQSGNLKLENVPAEYRTEVAQKLSGMEQTISSSQILTAARTMKQTDVENYLKSTYTKEQLAQMAKDAGFGKWYQTSAKEVENYLQSPSARDAVAKILEEQYRQSGYTIK